MAKKHKTRRIAHQVTDGRFHSDTITYGLERSTKTLKNAPEKSAYAKVRTKRRVTTPMIAEMLTHRLPGLSPRLAECVLDTFADIFVEKLREGNQIVLRDTFTMGLSFEGTVEPDRPFDVRTLPLAPWVRFAPNFLDRINRDVKIAYESPLLPTKVEISEVHRGERHFELRGNFRQASELIVDVFFADGHAIPCKAFFLKNPHSTRPSGKTVVVLPEDPIPAEEDVTLNVAWFEGTGEPRSAQFPLPGTPA